MHFLCCSPILPILLVAVFYITLGVPPPFLRSRLTVTTVPAGQVTSYKPYTYFASAAYCAANATATWSCGGNCEANPDFVPVAAGGDGTSVQYWFVGYSPSLQTAIVSHQGTNIKSILPILTDITFAQESLNSTLFPGLDSEIRVHSGFAGEHAKTAEAILTAVNTTLNTYNTNRVTVIGHSLGAALALLDSVYLSLHLPTTNLTTIGYGLPRVGNKDFADYVDAHNLSLTRITNRKDPVPGVPEQVLGYEHPSGEIHIQDTGTWNLCPGQDNGSALCSVGEVADLFEGSVSDHDGPYDGVRMGGC
ncbi:lipase class 3 family protein [Mycena leptocephala]|nr:lipase class 3 family protein [Mycena leptocephala]